MKRTTYIFIGIFIAVFVIASAGIVYLVSATDAMNEQFIAFKNGTLEKNLGNIRSLKYSVVIPEGVGIRSSDPLSLFVRQVNAGEVGKVVYPKSEYLKVNEEDGILSIQFDLTSPSLMENIAAGNSLFIDDCQIVVELGEELTSIYSDGYNTRVVLTSMELDSLNAYAHYLNVDSCVIRSLNIEGGETRFEGIGSTICNLYLNLDKVDRWTFDNCKIGTEYLTGSGQYRNDLQKEECDKVVWMPKTEEAQLHVTLREKSEILLLKD